MGSSKAKTQDHCQVGGRKGAQTNTLTSVQREGQSRAMRQKWSQEQPHQARTKERGNGKEKINNRKKRAPVSVLHWDYLRHGLHPVRLNSPPLGRKKENGGQDVRAQPEATATTLTCLFVQVYPGYLLLHDICIYYTENYFFFPDLQMMSFQSLCQGAKCIPVWKAQYNEKPHQQWTTGTLLLVQCLGLCISTAGGMGSISGRANKILHATKNKTNETMTNKIDLNSTVDGII